MFNLKRQEGGFIVKAVGSDSLTLFTPCPLFPLSILERGPGGEGKKPATL